MKVLVQKVRGLFLVSLDEKLSESLLTRALSEVLEQVFEKRPVGLILDLSGLSTFDSNVVGDLNAFISSVEVSGVRTAVCGLRAGSVGALITLGLSFSSQLTVQNIDQAISQLSLKA